jgi:microcompartment protein CcmL/EutN
MKRAIGIIEFTTVSAGIRAADIMLKAADVELSEAQAVCPGKFLIVASGSLSAVTASMEAAKHACGERYISGFVLGNPHESVLPAIYGTTNVPKLRALGVLETFDAATAVTAADTAAKTAVIELIEVRLAKGMCGKSYITMTGEVAAVEAAIEAAKRKSGESGMYLDSCVIANPDAKLERFFV